MKRMLVLVFAFIALIVLLPINASSIDDYGDIASEHFCDDNPMPWGWATWYAWQWRCENLDDSYTLPSDGLGNARYWDSQLADQFYIDENPQYGDVFVNKGGYYGHVGIVTGINDDGTITITDMNGSGGWGNVASSIVEADGWSNWVFIHERIASLPSNVIDEDDDQENPETIPTIKSPDTSIVRYDQE